MELSSLIFLISLAFIAEIIDSSMGMLYGTLLSPLLVILGYEATVVIPSVLLSQALGGIISSFFHHKYHNADFSVIDKKPSKDLATVIFLTFFGILATVFSVFIAVNLPKNLIKIYIGILVILMGFLVISKFKLTFSWKKVLILSLLSAFNKGITGGGYGPVVASGQTIIGSKYKSSIATTIFAKAPICIAGFLSYFFLKGFNDWYFLSALITGSVLAAPIGAYLTSKLDESKIKPILGLVIIISGFWILAQVLLGIAYSGS